MWLQRIENLEWLLVCVVVGSGSFFFASSEAEHNELKAVCHHFQIGMIKVVSNLFMKNSSLYF